MLKINLLNKLPSHNQLFYRVGDIATDVPNTTKHVILLSVHCQGSWYKGAAFRIRHKYPLIYKHQERLAMTRGKGLLGTYMEFSEGNRYVACIYASYKQGPHKDARSLILQNTHKALADYLWIRRYQKEIIIHSPRINWGMFAIPWSTTSKMIKGLLPYYPNVKWVVWAPPRKSSNTVQDLDD